VLNPCNQVSTRLAVFRPSDQQELNGSRAVSHYRRDGHKSEKYAMDVIANQAHDDCPRDDKSPVLQFESQEIGSSGERAGNGFESKRHGSARENPEKLKKR